MKILKHTLTATILLCLVLACEKDIELPDIQPVEEEESVFNLENPTVRSYLNFIANFPYKDGDYSYSYIDEYYQLTTSYRKDWPFPVKLSWNKNPDSISQKLYVGEREDMSDAYPLSIKNSVSTYDIYNLTPGKEYYWKVKATLDDGSEVVLNKSMFKTTGRRRFLSIEHVCNVRDLGGIVCTNGKTLKYGKIFRSGEMNGGHKDYDGNPCIIGNNGISELRKAGISADLDLRTASEAAEITKSPIGGDIDYIRFNNANTYFYDKFWTSDVYIKAFQWLIDELKAGKPVLFHCIYGADRTGTLAFLIEALLGVGENEIAIDYEMTSFSYGLNSPPRRRGPKNEISTYRYRQMLETVLTSNTLFKGTNLQERIRNFLTNGYPGATEPVTKISSEDMDWFIKNMLEE